MVSLWPLKLRFHISISLLILLIIGIMGIASISFIVEQSLQTAHATAEHEFKLISSSIRDRMNVLLSHVDRGAAIIAEQPQIAAPVIEDSLHHPALPLLTSTLRNLPNIYSIYVGHADGSFLQVIAAHGNDRILAIHKAPPGTDLIARSITAPKNADRRQHWVFLDKQGNVLGQRADSSVDYDPRKRGWYSAALAHPNGTLSQPYIFNSLQEPGITASHPVKDQGSVVGVDLTLSNMGAFLSSQDVSAHGGILLYDDRNHLMAATGVPELAPLVDVSTLSSAPFPQILKAGEGLSTAQTDDHNQLIIEQAHWQNAAGETIHLALFAPEEDFTGVIIGMRNKVFWLNIVLAAIGLPAAAWLSHRMARPVVELAEEAERMKAWDFSGTLSSRSFILEISALADGFAMMKKSLLERTRNLEQTQQSLSQLIDLGIAISGESDSHRLLNMILGRELIKGIPRAAAL